MLVPWRRENLFLQIIIDHGQDFLRATGVFQQVPENSSSQRLLTPARGIVIFCSRCRSFIRSTTRSRRCVGRKQVYPWLTRWVTARSSWLALHWTKYHGLAVRFSRSLIRTAVPLWANIMSPFSADLIEQFSGFRLHQRDIPTTF